MKYKEKAKNRGAVGESYKRKERKRLITEGVIKRSKRTKPFPTCISDREQKRCGLCANKAYCDGDDIIVFCKRWGVDVYKEEYCSCFADWRDSF